MKHALNSTFTPLPTPDPATDELALPQFIHLMPVGEFKGADGRGPYLASDLNALVDAFNADGRKLPIDENHSIDLVGTEGKPSPALGWIVAMEIRDDGLWGKVEWTPGGEWMLMSRAYGFISPVFFHTQSAPFRVVKVLRAALTNNPNLTQLKALHSRQEDMMFEELRKLLGLPETADQAAVMAAVTAMHAASAAHSTALASIATAAGAPQATTPEAIIAAMQSRQPVGTEQVAQLQQTVLALQGQINTMTADATKQKSTEAIDVALKSGKITPATKDMWLSMHQKDPAGTDALIAAMPSINAGGTGEQQRQADPTALSDEEKQVAAMMGIDTAEMLKNRKKEA